MSSQTVIGIGEMAISDDPAGVLITYSLGSCIGLVCYDPRLQLGGMVHSQLPLAAQAKGVLGNPCRYTDAGVAALLQAMFDRGAQRQQLIVCAVGGSQIMDDGNTFRIGERNQAVLRKILWKNGLLLAAQDLGGTASRTLSLHLATGEVRLRIKGETQILHPGSEGA